MDRIGDGNGHGPSGEPGDDAGKASATGIGQPVRRKEDLRLLTGRGRYSDDLVVPGQTVAHILRSPHAHAVITRIDTTAAKAAPGVLGVFTSADLAADGVKPIPPDSTFSARSRFSASCPISSSSTPTAPTFSPRPTICWPPTACASSARASPWSSQTR